MEDSVETLKCYDDIIIIINIWSMKNRKIMTSRRMHETAEKKIYINCMILLL